MKTSTYSIWREASGQFMLKQGTTATHPGDTCFKLIECATWEQAMAELHKFMDQRIKAGAVLNG